VPTGGRNLERAACPRVTAQLGEVLLACRRRGEQRLQVYRRGHGDGLAREEAHQVQQGGDRYHLDPGNQRGFRSIDLRHHERRAARPCRGLRHHDRAADPSHRPVEPELAA
jgi:hypothetical protein